MSDVTHEEAVNICIRIFYDDDNDNSDVNITDEDTIANDDKLLINNNGSTTNKMSDNIIAIQHWQL